MPKGDGSHFKPGLPRLTLESFGDGAIPPVAATLVNSDDSNQKEVFYRVDDAIRFLGRPSMSSFYRHIRNGKSLDAGVRGTWRVFRTIKEETKEKAKSDRKSERPQRKRLKRSLLTDTSTVGPATAAATAQPPVATRKLRRRAILKDSTPREGLDCDDSKDFKKEIDYKLLVELFWPGTSKHRSTKARVIPKWVYDDKEEAVGGLSIE